MGGGLLLRRLQVGSFLTASIARRNSCIAGTVAKLPARGTDAHPIANSIEAIRLVELVSQTKSRVGGREFFPVKTSSDKGES
jgi:hypothetical protein